jgi:monoamine oxidase
MGESIKIGLTYETPFWKNSKLSGTIFSNAGPIPEMYDHSNYENNKYALKGFLNGNYYRISKEERLKLILNQLEKYYGEQVHNYISYEELVWKNEKFTSTEYNDLVLPHQNNGEEIFQQGFLNDQLFIAGTETSPNFSGYMEGAVRSAMSVFSRINTIQLNN